MDSIAFDSLDLIGFDWIRLDGIGWDGWMDGLVYCERCSLSFSVQGFIRTYIHTYIHTYMHMHFP